MKHLSNALNMAISMFTVIPLPKYKWEEKSAKYIMRIYPVIGLIVGLIWYGVYKVLKFLGCEIQLFSVLLMITPFILTGFIHLDGFMDVCDALLSRRPKEEKLRILKDSRVGAFSVIALLIIFFIEFSAFNSFLTKGINPIVLIIIPVISRAMAGYFMITKTSIGESYYGKLFKDGTGTRDRVILITIYILMVILGYFLGNKYIIMSLIIGISSFVLVKKCEKELGGINGDVAGYILTVSELFGILVLAII